MGCADLADDWSELAAAVKLPKPYEGITDMGSYFLGNVPLTKCFFAVKSSNQYKLYRLDWGRNRGLHRPFFSEPSR